MISAYKIGNHLVGQSSRESIHLSQHAEKAISSVYSLIYLSQTAKAIMGADLCLISLPGTSSFLLLLQRLSCILRDFVLI